MFAEDGGYELSNRLLNYYIGSMSEKGRDHVAEKLIGEAFMEIHRLNHIIDDYCLATTAECTCGGKLNRDSGICPACKIYHAGEKSKKRNAAARAFTRKRAMKAGK